MLEMTGREGGGRRRRRSPPSCHSDSGWVFGSQSPGRDWRQANTPLPRCGAFQVAGHCGPYSPHSSLACREGWPDEGYTREYLLGSCVS